jgi:hypothetical protein
MSSSVRLHCQVSDYSLGKLNPANEKIGGDPVSEIDAFKEFNELRKKAGVTKWKAKWVQRKYAFGEKDVPITSHRYLKVLYGFDGK